LQDRIRGLEAANDEAPRQNHQKPATDLEAVTRLQSVATQLISARGMAELYEILDSVKGVLHADFASIQMFCPERGTHGELRLLAHRGFSEEAAKRWEWVCPTTQTACGGALRTRQRVVFPDIRRCDFIAGSDELQVYLSAGIKAVQTTPLVSRSGALVGMVSTHWREAREPAARELRALDLLARMAADLIERLRVEEAPAENQQHPVTGRLTSEVSVAPVIDGKGTCTHLVTDRKEAEQRFRDSEARLALAQDAAQIGVWDSDLKTNVITIRGHFARLHGLSPDRTTITRQEWSSLIHPDDRERVDALRRQARERTHTFDAEFRVLWPEGSTHWVHAKGTVSIDDFGQPSRTTGVVWDITERKQAEAKLGESEERFRRVFEEGPLGIALVARDQRFLKVNNALCQMLGYPEEELLQKTFADITHPDDLRADLELVERLFRGELPLYRMQKRYVKKTGEIIWINLTASLLRDRASNSLQRLTMIEDVTEIKRSQEAAILSQKLESVGTLASGIAHDFNNLLGAVLAQAELAQAELAEGSSPEAELKTIRDAALRGSEIVRELMIYAGKGSRGLELVDVSEAVEQMLELVKISISKRATFKIDLAHNLPSIRATAGQISQLVMNLATNASEALGDRDGVIRITTRRVMAGHGSQEMRSMAKGEYVQVEVSDTGCGISPETQARIFDPFFSTKAGGRGLGLAVVHGIVKDLGGAINLVSEPGHGTTFQISLPCAEAPSDSTGEVTLDIGQPAPPSQAATVLVVEDEDPLRQPVSKMLSKAGFSVIEARDGSAALDAIRAQNKPIQVLFLDITIPGASARDVYQEARRLRPEMRVVVTSAYTEEMAARSLQSAIERFIRKPYRLNDLVRLIELSIS
jgi:two-component system, cell cycle sensor histidine kinase and response regulator CckA